jgi:hypothetical protein
VDFRHGQLGQGAEFFVQKSMPFRPEARAAPHIIHHLGSPIRFGHVRQKSLMRGPERQQINSTTTGST